MVRQGSAVRIMVVALGVLLVAIVGLGVWVVGMLGEDAAPVELRLRLEPGRSYALKMATEQTVEIEGQGAAQKISNSAAYTLDVQNIDAQGNAVTRVTIDSMTMELGALAPQGAGADPGAILSSALATLKGKQFTATISPVGKTVGVAGLEAARAAAQSGGDLMAAMVLSQILSDAVVTHTFDGALGVFPRGPVTTGSTWSGQASFSAGVPIEASYTFRLKERSEGVATIRVEGTFSAAAPQAEGSMDGTMKVDEATGCILQSKVTHDITGGMKARGVTASSFTQKGYTESATSEGAGG